MRISELGLAYSKALQQSYDPALSQDQRRRLREIANHIWNGCGGTAPASANEQAALVAAADHAEAR